jgi:hypothetical protein
MPFPSFDHYDHRELKICAQAFRERFIDQRYRWNEKWKTQIFEWFTERRHPDACVCFKEKGGEFLVDYYHTTYPSTSGARLSHIQWKDALCRPCKVLLAIEYERGRAKDRNRSTAMISDDARKLATIRANAKVMIFCSHDAPDSQKAVAGLARLRRNSGDNSSPWLYIDMRWQADRQKTIRYQGDGVLSD